MSAEEFKIGVQLLSVMVGPLFLYHGYRRVFNKKYYMRISEGYVGDDVDAEYEKQKRPYHYARRYVSGIGFVLIGGMFLSIFFWATFFLSN
jgi:hypothetical protein